MALSRDPRIAVIVVNWNCEAFVEATVRSIERWNVIVVDNASDSAGALSSLQCGRVTVLRNSENLGYGGGMNVGMRYARERGFSHALLLNPDTLVSDELIDVMSREIRDAAVLGIEQHYCTPDGRDTGVYPSAAVLSGARPQIITLADGETVSGIDVVTGAAILVSLDWAHHVGYICEDYFHYKEEFDFVYRIRRSGGLVLFTSKAVVLHRSGGSLSTSSPRAEYYRARNEIIFVVRHFGRLALLRLPGFWLDCVRRACRGRRAFRAVVVGVCHGLTGRIGRNTGRF